ncbi:class I SAM-dependent methyltransferase [Inhella gelatinilytica]|uniref:SAM-dependent methyltransferase n=1 Tax=Inhella gelatinilytica TaxID=2795030 RepID=A0A931IWM3_9BURK|nr:SAM-dependent methyltransferase [Inhella gelatinilytica]MBH9551983.1 SAM-dependent methyltransferase [Inhella gelatinilytica]
MPGYLVSHHVVAVSGGADLTIRSLQDKQQHADPSGLAAAARISSAQWSLFGQLWPAGQQLAAYMATRPLSVGENILEIGCGLALASLVCHRRGALVTASDCHPLAGAFLLENLRLNGLAPMRYCHGAWGVDTGVPQAPRVQGRFELIMGSDVLYERDDAGTLPAFIRQHAAARGEILILDPNRGNRAAFHRAMALQGYERSELRVPPIQTGAAEARLLRYQRAA